MINFRTLSFPIFIKFLSVGTTFLIFYILANKLSIESFGIFNSYLNTLFLLNLFLLFGVDKKVLVLSSRSPKSKLIKNYVFSLFINIVVITYIFLTIIFLYFYVYKNLLHIENILFYSILPITLVNITLQNYLIGKGMVIKFQLINSFLQNIIFLIFLFFLENLLNLLSVIVFFILSNLINASVAVYFTKTLFNNLKFKFILINKILKKNFYFWISNLLLNSFYLIDLIILGIIASKSDLGLISFAIKIALMPRIVYLLFQNIFISKLIVDFSSKNYSLFISNYKKFVYSIMLFFLPIAILFCNVDILNYFFQTKFSDVYHLIFYIGFAFLLVSIFGPIDSVFVLINNSMKMIRWLLIILIIFILMLCYFYLTFGITYIHIPYIIFSVLMIILKVYLIRFFLKK